ncbi:MAG: UDP-N-acetylglucosamine 4,6-dehydratase (inverting) [Alphaproteobacteria bacterium]
MERNPAAALSLDSANSLDGRSVLVTGATGSFGQRFVRQLLERGKPRRLVVFSRDEMKQFEMAQRFPEGKHPCLRYFIGDVRDRERVFRACAGIDIIVHAAAMKHIPASEYNPTECIATNIGGAQNVIDAAIANDAERVVALSTDKAANPINLYGATKLCSDKLFVAANNLAGRHRTRFAIVRYGNVIGSRGSVIPFFKRLVAEGRRSLPITHAEMTRFVITLEEGVAFVLHALKHMAGGEIFVPKLPSIRIVDLAKRIAPDLELEFVGIRPGEKLHEVMIPYEESRLAYDMRDHFIIAPAHSWWDIGAFEERVAEGGNRLAAPFEYSSESNDWWLDDAELGTLVEDVPAG